MVLPDYRLSNDVRTYLETTVNTFYEKMGDKMPDLESFFEEVESAVAIVRAQQQLAKESRPAAVRKNLKRACDTAVRLKARLKELDGNSCRLLDHTTEGGVSAVFLQVEHVIKGLRGALQLAKEYPPSGNLLKKYHLDLAIDIAIAIENNLGVNPKTTRGGLFDEVLGVVMGEATGKEYADVHGLVGDALAMRQKRSDGTVEYLPPGED